MQYRELARTGLRVSEIGLGCEGFSGKTQAEAMAWINTALASVMISVYTMEELQDCLDYEQASAEERDYAMALAAMPKVSWRGHCMYCGHYTSCPRGMDVGMVTKLRKRYRKQCASIMRCWNTRPGNASAAARAKRDAPSAWRSANTCAQPKKSFVNKKERENI